MLIQETCLYERIRLFWIANADGKADCGSVLVDVFMTRIFPGRRPGCAAKKDFSERLVLVAVLTSGTREARIGQGKGGDGAYAALVLMEAQT